MVALCKMRGTVQMTKFTFKKPKKATIWTPDGKVVVVGQESILGCTSDCIVIRDQTNEERTIYCNMPMIFEHEKPLPE